jgi:hypothetical protein
LFVPFLWLLTKQTLLPVWRERHEARIQGPGAFAIPPQAEDWEAISRYRITQLVEKVKTTGPGRYAPALEEFGLDTAG